MALSIQSTINLRNKKKECFPSRDDDDEVWLGEGLIELEKSLEK